MTNKVWKQKVVLNKAILEKLCKFYRYNFDESLLELDCFSHPGLIHHECNPEAKLPGGADCKFCRNVFGSVCQITCHISQFCLIMFAYRLGIGGEDFEIAYTHNSKMDYEALYRLVRQRLNDLEKGAETPIKDSLQLGFGFSKTNYVPGVAKPAVMSYVEDAAEEVAEDWLTLNEAATWYKCAYANIFAHVKRGNLPHRIFGGVKKVRKSDLMKLQQKNKRKRSSLA